MNELMYNVLNQDKPLYNATNRFVSELNNQCRLIPDKNDGHWSSKNSQLLALRSSTTFLQIKISSQQVSEGEASSHFKSFVVVGFLFSYVCKTSCGLPKDFFNGGTSS